MTYEQQSGLRITAVVRIDVTAKDAVYTIADLGHLAPHSRVIVDVRDVYEADDPRVVEFLAYAAHDQALHLEVHGTSGAVAYWVNALHRCEPPPPPRDPLRHLKPVDGGDPA
jgi:hypothetical protein